MIIIENDFTDINVQGGRIFGKVIFSCFMNAMYYPTDSDKARAILSRSIPIFETHSKKTIKKITSGDYTLDLEPFTSKTRSCIIPLKTSKCIHTIYWNYISKYRIKPSAASVGFLSRIYIDLIRFSVSETLTKKSNKIIEFCEDKVFEKVCRELLKEIWNNYTSIFDQSNKSKFLNFYMSRPNLSYTEYGDIFHVDERTIRRWLNER